MDSPAPTDFPTEFLDQLHALEQRLVTDDAHANEHAESVQRPQAIANELNEQNEGKLVVANTPVIKQVTVPAATSVGVLAALGETIGTLIYTVMVYAPQSESLNLSLADASGTPTDPESTIPAQDNPFVVEATRDEVFLYNSGSVSVTVICRAHVRGAAG